MLAALLWWQGEAQREVVQVALLAFAAELPPAALRLAAAFWPERVIVRMSDFKSNEYANLVGGRGYEPHLKCERGLPPT